MMRRMLDVEKLGPELLHENLQRLREWVRSMNLSPEDSYAMVVAGGAMYFAGALAQTDPEMLKLMAYHVSVLSRAILEAMKEEDAGKKEVLS